MVPRSLMFDSEKEYLPTKLRELIENAETLYDQSLNKKILQDHTLYQVDKNSVVEIKEYGYPKE